MDTASNRIAEARRLSLAWIGLLAALVLAGCTSASTLPVYRIGLVAPFEGRYRELGYDMIYAARLAVQDALAAGTMDGYRVELVAYDDSGDPEQAAVQARALAADPAVFAAIGHARAETTRAAARVYREAGLPLIAFEDAGTDSTPGVFVLDAAPEVRQAALDAYLAEHAIPASTVFQAEAGSGVTEAAALVWSGGAERLIGDASWGTQQFHELTRDAGEDLWFLSGFAWPGDLPDGAAFREMLLDSSLYVPEPGPLAPLTYDAVRLALEAIDRARAGGTLTRAQVREAIGAVSFDGLTGPIAFDADGFRQDAPLYLYRWAEEDTPLLVERLR